MRDAHQTFDHAQSTEVPSNRNFGLTVGGILSLIGAIRWMWQGEASWLTLVFLILGVPLIAAALFAPGSLSRLNRLWMGLGFLLARIVSPIVMFLIFIVVFLPIGLVMRLRGYDPLRLRMRPEAAPASYWVERERTDSASVDFTNQF